MLENLWLIFATILVFSMQGGFLLLEAGSIRTKNAISVAQKNIADFSVCWVVFMVSGFSIMFGLPSPLIADNSTYHLSFLFQLAFCGTAATIVSGAVAERMKFNSYLVLVFVMVTLIYPLVGWSIWGSLFIENRVSWLGDLGFIDFAGATVVHSVGAWVSLAACLYLGPRLGRFSESGEPNAMPGHSAVLSGFGTLLLLVGWLGFNGGNLSSDDPLLPRTLLNTVNAACVGGISAMFYGYVVDHYTFNPSRLSMGILSGLVSITASAAYVSLLASSIIGCLSALAAVSCSQWLLGRYKVDDPLNVVSIHGSSGVIGTLLVAVFVEPQFLQFESRWSQLAIQLLGVTSVFSFTFSVSFLVLWGINKLSNIRVSADQEYLGLNYTEHGASLSTEQLKRALNRQQFDLQTFRKEVAVDHIDDSSEIAESLHTLLQRYEDAQRLMNEQVLRFQDFANTTSDYFWETDAEFNIRYLSHRFSELSELSIEQSRGYSLLTLLNVRKEDRETCFQCLKNQQAIPRIEVSIFTGKAMNLRTIELSGVPYFDVEHNLLGYRGVANDITLHRAAEKRALFLAYHDELTGLGNRRILTEELGDMLRTAKQQSQGLSVVGIDLDGFKQVNDSFGHSMGDALLIRVAERLRSILTPNDRVYRVGGDEFIVILSHEPRSHLHQHAKLRCQKLLKSLQSVYDIETSKIYISASIGICCYPSDSHSENDLMRMADIAMYQAKRQGKNMIVNFQKAMDHESSRREEVKKALLLAFERKEFFLCYQPHIALSTGDLIGFEALLRWRHPGKGVLHAKHFMPIVDRLGFSERINDYVLHEACHFVHVLQARQRSEKSNCSQSNRFTSDLASAIEGIPSDKKTAHQDFKVTINISLAQLKAKNFIACIDAKLKASKIRPYSLMLGVQEDTLKHNIETTSQVLKKIHDMHIDIAVDNFSCNKMSLQYVKHFPVNQIKISPSTVKGLHRSKRLHDFTQDLVGLAHQLGLSVMAEGVEDTRQLRVLRDLECDVIQGYLISKPLHLTQVYAFIDKYNNC